MLGKKMGSVKKLAKRVKLKATPKPDIELSSPREYLLRDVEDSGLPLSTTTTPTGFFALYIGEERQRFVVPTGYLSHPLFKMLLEKSYDESTLFQQSNRLVIPCSIAAFQEVVAAIECCNRKFDFGKLVQEFI